jgi:hypothetical protein
MNRVSPASISEQPVVNRESLYRLIVGCRKYRMTRGGEIGRWYDELVARTRVGLQVIRREL